MKKVAVWALVAAALAAGGAACTTADPAAKASPAKKHNKPAATSKAPAKPAESSGQRNAREAAESYLETMAFSKSGLAHQLKYEGYSQKDVTYAVGAIDVDWNEQAVKVAKSYLDTMPFSQSDLIGQLEHDGFTASQAEYGVKKAY